MSDSIRRKPRRRSRRGSILILALFMIVAGLAAAAICVDVAYMQLVQTQLRTATDAAARAGAASLAQGDDISDIRQLTKDIAKANLVAGTELKLDDADIVFGLAESNPSDPNGNMIFTPTTKVVNALRVQGRRTSGSPSGSVSFLLGQKVFGAGPFEPSKFATVTIAQRDIVLVLDRSGSMEGEDAGELPESLEVTYGGDPVYDHDEDGSLRRVEALKVSVREFRKVIDTLPSEEQLGLVTYNTSASADASLNVDYASFDTQAYDMQVGGNTNIGAGIDAALAMLQNPALARPTADPVIIVMTDGQHNGERDPVEAATAAMAALPNLSIHTVTFSSGADIPRMQSVANIGKGKHVHASDVSALVEDFEDMARSAGVMMVE